MNLARLQNPNILKDPYFKEFLLGAHQKSIFKEMEVNKFLDDMAAIIADPGVGVHVVVEKGDFRGISVTYLPRGPLAVHPSVRFFYMKKGKNWGMKKALTQAIVDFLQENHYTTAWAVNGTGVPDSVYGRAFKPGGPLTKVGSVVEFNFGG